jgi:hypothetical protein
VVEKPGFYRSKVWFLKIPLYATIMKGLHYAKTYIPT